MNAKSQTAMFFDVAKGIKMIQALTCETNRHVARTRSLRKKIVHTSLPPLVILFARKQSIDAFKIFLPSFLI